MAIQVVSVLAKWKVVFFSDWQPHEMVDIVNYEYCTYITLLFVPISLVPSIPYALTFLSAPYVAMVTLAILAPSFVGILRLDKPHKPREPNVDHCLILYDSSGRLDNDDDDDVQDVSIVCECAHVSIENC